MLKRTLPREEGDNQEETMNIVRGIMPSFDDTPWAERKKEYLAYRFCGFGPREAAQMLDLHERTVRRWRSDVIFESLERAIGTLSARTARTEILTQKFIRNFTLILDRDYRMLLKAAGRVKNEDGEIEWANNAELDWLKRARSSYTLDQLKVVEEVLSPASKSEKPTFAQYILNMTNQTTYGDSNGKTQTVESYSGEDSSIEA